MIDDLIPQLDALGEEDFYYFPATTKAKINEAKAALKSQAARIETLEAALRFANEYVGRLAFTLAEKHYPEQRFELLPDLLGRIDQIDNMTCGLHRAKLTGGEDG